MMPFSRATGKAGNGKRKRERERETGTETKTGRSRRSKGTHVVGIRL